MARLAKAGLITFLFLGAIILLYAGAALVCALFPQVGRLQHISADDLPIYVCADQVHADLIFSARDKNFSGAETFGPDFTQLMGQADYYSIGWGDFVFLTELAKISDASPPMVLKALTGRNDAAIRLYGVSDPASRPDCQSLMLDAAGKKALQHYIAASLQTPQKRTAVGTPHHQPPYILYYFTSQRYGPFSTCNQWIANGLGAAGAPHAIFAPFSFGVTWPLKR